MANEVAVAIARIERAGLGPQPVDRQFDLPVNDFFVEASRNCHFVPCSGGGFGGIDLTISTRFRRRDEILERSEALRQCLRGFPVLGKKHPRSGQQIAG
jgi:hypothetical protein